MNNQTSKDKKRKSNFDLLRIFAMLIIIIHHLTINGLGLSKIDGITINSGFGRYAILSFIECFVIIGVNLFFLLSGFFGIKFSFKKVITLLLDIYIYSTVIISIGLLSGAISLNSSIIKTLIFPLKTYWFILVYILLIFLSPYLNIVIEFMNNNQYKTFIITVLFLFGILAFITNSSLIGSNGGYSLLSAAYLYIIGGGCRKFDEIKNKEEKKRMFLLYCLCCGVNFLISLVAIYILRNGSIVWKLYSYNNILNILASIYLLRFFKRISISGKLEKLIFKITPSILAVYYIHSSSWLSIIRDMPLKYATNNFNLILLIIPLIFYSILIFTICICIDKIKKRLLDKYINNVSEFIDRRLNNVIIRKYS